MPDSDPLSHLSEIVRDIAIDPTTEAVGDLSEGRPVIPFLRPDQVESHPAHATFLAALEAHSVLGRLFPDDQVGGGVVRGFRPRSVATRLINATLWGTYLDGDASTDAVEASLAAGLAGLEGLVRGEPVSAREWVGFGVELPPGTEIPTPWGTLRARRPSDRIVLAQAGADHLPDAGCILETKSSLFEDVLPGPQPRVLEVSSGIAHERWQRVALAFLLAEGGDRVSPAHPWCHIQMQPLGYGALSAEFEQFMKGGRFEDASDVARLTMWLDRASHPRLSPITIERTVSMARRIVDPVDAFIDAVIVWESLFGAGDTQELSYRVSMTMACVLSADPDQRVALQREIKALYTLRSRVVHGGKRLSSSQAIKTRQRAEGLTLDALRAVLEDHAHLLGQDAPAHVAFVLGAPAPN